MSGARSDEFFDAAEALAADERVLWRGAPEWRGLAWRAFHAREALAWFALVGIARGVVDVAGGASVAAAIRAQALLLPISVVAIASLCLLAWLSARTTRYTLTEHRLLMRIGIALPLTVNIPLAKIGSASLRRRGGGTGDLGVAFTDGTRLAWLVLWPHCRPWRLRHPEPMLRAIADADRVADLLSSALAGTAAAGEYVRTPAPGRVIETASGLPAGGIGATT